MTEAPRSPDGRWRWDGTAWRPRRVRFVVPALVSIAGGTAIWLATMAVQPRYEHSASNTDDIYGWVYFGLMVAAALVLPVVFANRWEPVAPGLIVPQLLLAGPTAPRGDGDGLWILIYPMLLFGGLFLYLFTYVVAAVARGRVTRREAGP